MQFCTILGLGFEVLSNFEPFRIRVRGFRPFGDILGLGFEVLSHFGSFGD